MGIPKIYGTPEYSEKYSGNHKKKEEEKSLGTVLEEEEMWRGQPKVSRTHFSLHSMKKLSKAEEKERKGCIIEYLSTKKVQCETPKRSKNIQKLKIFKTLETDHLFFLKNGQMKRDHYHNTCAFDAFVQCISNINHPKFVNPNRSHFSSLIIALLNWKEDSAKVHRHAILAKLYGLNWDCTANITKISDHFLNELNYCSIQTTSTCQSCNISGMDQYKYLPIDLGRLDKLGIKMIQECIMEPNTLYCSCGTEKTINQIKSKPIIFLYSETTIELIESITISNIPFRLNVYNESFDLTGFVSYIRASAHYIAYCYHNERWEKYDDLLETATNIKFPHAHKVTPHLLIYQKRAT